MLVNHKALFMEQSFLAVTVISVLVFSFFNFRPKGKAKCFAGDVGSVGMAFILLFAIGMLIVRTGDITWLVLLLVYGMDGCLTICHRIMLHEHLGEAHRKHAYQLMANELKISHPTVSAIYMVLQLAIGSSLDISDLRNHCPYCSVCSVYEKILSPSRRVPGFVKQMTFPTYPPLKHL